MQRLADNSLAPVTDLTLRIASVEELMRRAAEGDETAIAELCRRGGELPEWEAVAA